jgi:hypothetical protein
MVELGQKSKKDHGEREVQHGEKDAAVPAHEQPHKETEDEANDKRQEQEQGCLLASTPWFPKGKGHGIGPCPEKETMTKGNKACPQQEGNPQSSEPFGQSQREDKSQPRQEKR